MPLPPRHPRAGARSPAATTTCPSPRPAGHGFGDTQPIAVGIELDAVGGAATCTTAKLPAGLRGPMQPVLVGLDPRPRASVKRTDQELDALVGFVRDGLLDPDARPERLRAVIPTELPSGRAGFVFR